MTEKIVVIDYGSSNLNSVVKALKSVTDKHHVVSISNQAEIILAANRIVFPGQGAIGQCMHYLKEQKLDEVIRQCILKKPFLGICLGLQSLLDHSDEDGGVAGLGILPGNVVRFQTGVNDEKNRVCKIPAMGWNQVHQHQSHPLWKGIDDGSRFYFLHSYYALAKIDSDIVGTTDYICRYTAAVARGHLFAVQFHPEKSQRAGLTLLKNFIKWRP